MPLSLLQELPAVHDDRVWSVAFGAGTWLLASASADGTVAVYVRSSLRPLSYAHVQTLAMPPQAGRRLADGTLTPSQIRTVRSVAFSPTGKHLAVASFDAVTRIFVNRGTLDAPSFSPCEELSGHQNEVKCVAWSPDGATLATCARDRTIWTWDAQGGAWECASVLHGHVQDVKSVAFHPTNPSMLVSASYDNSIRVWAALDPEDPDEWQCVAQCAPKLAEPHEYSRTRETHAHADTVWSSRFGPAAAGGHVIVSGSADGTARLWLLRNGEAGAPLLSDAQEPPYLVPLDTLEAHDATRPVYAAIFARPEAAMSEIPPHRALVVTASGDHSVAVVPLKPGVMAFGEMHVVTKAHAGEVNTVDAVLTETGAVVASGGDDGLVKLWAFVP
jgi:WD40 repeat protein